MIHKKLHEGKHLQKYLTKAPWYLISSVITKMMGFILLPIYTTHFSQEEVGVLSIYESIGRVVVVFISLYLDAAFTRYYFKVQSESQHSIAKFFSTHFWFLLFWGLFVCLGIGFLFQPGGMGLPLASNLVIPALLTSQFFAQLIMMLTSLWAVNLYVQRLAVFNVSFSLLALLLTIYFVVVKGQGWEYRLYVISIISCIQFIFVFVVVIKKELLLLSFDFAIIKRSLKYSLPLVPNVIAGWIAMFSDRILLSHYGHLDDVGIYSVAAQLTLVLYIVNDSITRIQGPLAMSGMTDNMVNAKNKMSDFIHLYLSILIFIYILISSIIPLIVDLAFGNKYKEVSIIFSILGWVYILSGIYRVFTNVISYHNATWSISIGAIAQAIANVSANVMLIPYYGMYAAALSTLFSMFVYTCWLSYISQKLDRISLEYLKLIGIVLVGSVSAFVFQYLDSNSFDLKWIYVCKLFVVGIGMSLLCLLQKEKHKYIIIQSIRKCWDGRFNS